MRKLFWKARACVARGLGCCKIIQISELYLCVRACEANMRTLPRMAEGWFLSPDATIRKSINHTEFANRTSIRTQTTFGRLQIKIANKRRARNGKYSKLKSILGFRYKNVSNGYFSFDNPQLIASRRFHLFYRKGDASAPAAISFHHLIRFSARRAGYRRSRLSAIRLCIF